MSRQIFENYDKDNPELVANLKAELFGTGEVSGDLGGMLTVLFPEPNSPRIAQAKDQLWELLIKDHDLFMNEVLKIDNRVTEINSENKKGGSDSVIDSVEALARFIVQKQNAELWGEDGELPIIKDGKFNETNFILWLRQQSGELHWDNPNAKMAPLEAVGIQNIYGSFIPIYFMTRFKEQYLKDESSGRVLTDLAEDLKYEAFLFGDWRNAYLIHRQGGP